MRNLKRAVVSTLAFIIIAGLLAVLPGALPEASAAAPYHVTYDGNGSTGGTVPTDAADYAENAEVTTLGNTGTLVRDGYDFDGWNTQADGLGTTYDPESPADNKFIITADITLYAKWTATTTAVAITHGTGATAGTSPVTMTYGQAAPSFTAPTYTGKVLNGYFTAETGGTKIIGSDGALEQSVANYTDGTGKWINTGSSLTLYAQWSDSVTTITINAGGGTGGTTAANVTYGNSTITASGGGTFTVLTRAGYSLNGYFTAATGGTKVIGSDGALQPSVANYTDGTGKWINTGSSLTLYAQWTAKEYTVTFDLEGGAAASGTPATPATAYLKFGDGFYTASGGSTKLADPIGKPTKLAYIFAGFYTGSNGAGEKIFDEDGKLVTGAVTKINGAATTATVYAYWTENELAIKTGDEGKMLSGGKTYTVAGTSVALNAGGGTVINGLVVSGSATINIPEGSTLSVTGGNGCAGIHVPYGATLTLTGKGTLNVSGGAGGAGIGGMNNTSGKNAGTVVIQNGLTLTVSGGANAAAIGGANGGDGGTVRISGSALNLTGGQNAATIGGGRSGDGADVIISGGTVKLVGTASCADIGPGLGGAGGSLTVTGGTVFGSDTATVGALKDSATPVNAVGNTTKLTIVTLNYMSSGAETGLANAEASSVTLSSGIYGLNDARTDADGKLYMYLYGTTVTSVTAKLSGAFAVFRTATTVSAGNLIGKFISAKSNVVFNTQGGGAAPANVEASYGVKLSSVAVPTKAGNTFKGYNTASDGTGNTYIAASGSATAAWAETDASVTLYAQWQANAYDINYNDNADGNMVYNMPLTGVKTHGTAYIVKPEGGDGTPTREGYTFADWNTKADGTGTAYNRGISYTVDAELTLYAQWTPIEYRIVFNKNGATGAQTMAAITGVKYDESKALTANAFTNEHNYFYGWNTKADGKGDDYADKASVRNLRKTAGDVTLYAMWTEAPKVVFTPAAGTYNAAQSVTLACGTAGAKIYYTTDGTTPTTSSTEYSAARPISVAATTTNPIRAIAVATGVTSAETTADYVIIDGFTGDGKVLFANGKPITIQATVPAAGTSLVPGGYTEPAAPTAYAVMGTGATAKYVALAGDYTVYGGSDGTTDTASLASASITMNGGEIKSIFGGNKGAELSAYADVAASAVLGNATITINDGTVHDCIAAGGTGNASVGGTAQVIIKKLNTSATPAVYGGVLGYGSVGLYDDANGTVKTNAVVVNSVVNVNGCKLEKVFAGGSGMTKVNTAALTLGDGIGTADTEIASVYASSDGRTQGAVTVGGAVGTANLTLAGDVKVTAKLAGVYCGYLGTGTVTINGASIALLCTGADPAVYAANNSVTSYITNSISYTVGTAQKVTAARLTPAIRQTSSGAKYSICGTTVVNNVSSPALSIELKPETISGGTLNDTSITSLALAGNETLSIDKNMTLTVSDRLALNSASTELENDGKLIFGSASSVVNSGKLTNKGQAVSYKASLVTGNALGYNSYCDISWYTAAVKTAKAYTITDSEKLAGVAYLVNQETEDFKGWTLTLGGNVSLDGFDSWTPIGFFKTSETSKGFKGTFDGDNYRITNLAIASGDTANERSYGLFGQVGGGSVFKNLTIVSADVTPDNGATPTPAILNGPMGALAGSYSGAAASSDTLTVTNVNIDGGKVTAAGAAGGVIGKLTTGSGNIAFDSVLSSAAVTGADCAGGLVGSTGSIGYTTVNNCRNSGAIVANDAAGGAVGLIAGGCEIKLTGFANSGAVTAKAASDSCAGGIVGSTADKTLLDGCRSTGAITAGNGTASTTVFAGYLVGQNVANTDNYKATITAFLSSSGTLKAANTAVNTVEGADNIVGNERVSVQPGRTALYVNKSGTAAHYEQGIPQFGYIYNGTTGITYYEVDPLPLLPTIVTGGVSCRGMRENGADVIFKVSKTTLRASSATEASCYKLSSGVAADSTVGSGTMADPYIILNENDITECTQPGKHYAVSGSITLSAAKQIPAGASVIVPEGAELKDVAGKALTGATGATLIVQGSATDKGVTLSRGTYVYNDATAEWTKTSSDPSGVGDLFFANGVEIIIQSEKPSSGTAATITGFTSTGTDAYILWTDSAGAAKYVGVRSDVIVFGAKNDEEYAYDTSITMNGGAVTAMFGGGMGTGINSADARSTMITINGGTVGKVYGGGNAKSAVATAEITVNGGTVTELYGGGLKANAGDTNTVASAKVTVNNGTVTEVCASAENGTVTGTATLKITGGATTYAYGVCDGTTTGTLDVIISGGSVERAALGRLTNAASGVAGTVTGDAKLKITGAVGHAYLGLGAEGANLTLDSNVAVEASSGSGLGVVRAITYSAASKTMRVAPGTEFTIPSGGTFTVGNGTLLVDADTSSSTPTYGKLTVNGTLANASGSTLTNNGVLELNKTMTNAGTFNHNGTFTVAATGTLTLDSAMVRGVASASPTVSFRTGATINGNCAKQANDSNFYNTTNVKSDAAAGSTYSWEATLNGWKQASTVNVSFEVPTGATAPAPNPQPVAPGAPMAKPTNPTWTGHKFVAWYKESTYTTEWDFTDDVAGAMSLYGRFVLIGDANLDGTVTIDDVTLTIAFVLGRSTPSAAQFAAAQVKSTGATLSINDITAIIGIVLGRSV